MTDRPAAAASSAAEATAAVAPVIPGMAEEEADDPNEYFEPEPVDPTMDELKVRGCMVGVGFWVDGPVAVDCILGPTAKLWTPPQNKTKPRRR